MDKSDANDQSAIAKTIKADVAHVVAGINAHDPIKTTAYDAPDIISMECGSPSTVGIEADREGSGWAFSMTPFGKSVSSTRRSISHVVETWLSTVASTTKITVPMVC